MSRPRYLHDCITSRYLEASTTQRQRSVLLQPPLHEPKTLHQCLAGRAQSLYSNRPITRRPRPPPLISLDRDSANSPSSCTRCSCRCTYRWWRMRTNFWRANSSTSSVPIRSRTTPATFVSSPPSVSPNTSLRIRSSRILSLSPRIRN